MLSFIRINMRYSIVLQDCWPKRHYFYGHTIDFLLFHYWYLDIIVNFSLTIAANFGCWKRGQRKKGTICNWLGNPLYNLLTMFKDHKIPIIEIMCLSIGGKQRSLECNKVKNHLMNLLPYPIISSWWKIIRTPDRRNRKSKTSLFWKIFIPKVIKLNTIFICVAVNGRKVHSLPSY